MNVYLARVGRLMFAFAILCVLPSTAGGLGSWQAQAGMPELVAEVEEPQSISAPPFTEYVYSQVNLGGYSTGAAVAKCPDDSIVVGGGYAADPSVTFYTQYKYENGWRGDAMNNYFGSKMITVFAVCLYNVVGVSVTQVHGQVDVSPGTKDQAVATCPAGTVATGGGFHAYPDGSLRVYNSSKADSGEGWQSWAENLSVSTKTHHAYAVCLSGSSGTTADILKSVNVPPDSSAYAIPECSIGTLVTGGGFAAQKDLLIYSTSGPYAGNEWRVYVRNTHLSEDRTLFGYAICLTLPVQPGYGMYLPVIVQSYSP